MSASEGKEDPCTPAVGENIIPPDKSALTNPTDAAENITKSLELGVGVTKKDENDGNLISIDSDTVEKGNIVDTNLKSDIFAEVDQTFDKAAPIATELSKTTPIEVPSTSKTIIDKPQTVLMSTDEQKAKIDETILDYGHTNPNPDIKTLKSQEKAPEDITPNIGFEKTQEITTNEPINPVADEDKPFDDSFDADLELKWEDDEKDDEYSTNLSDEALKILDKELGIEDEVAKVKTNIKIADDIPKQSVNTDTKEEQVEGIAKNVTENIDAAVTSNKLDNYTKISSEVIQPTDENKDFESSTVSKSELIEIDVNSKVSNEEITVPSSNIAVGIAKEDDIDNNLNMEELNQQNQLELITDKGLTSGSNDDIVKDVPDSPKYHKLQITEDTIEMVTETPKVSDNSKIIPNIEEMDVDISENVNKIEVVDKPVQLTEQSNIVGQEIQMKIDTTINIKEVEEIPLQMHSTDIEMTEITDQSLTTKNETESIQHVLIDEAGTTKVNEKEEPFLTKGMKTDLGLNKPDIMLEIPTQELIDIDDFDDSTGINKEITDSEDTSTSKTKPLVEGNTTTNEKNTKIIEQSNITQSEEKDITVTELVRIATEKERLVEETGEKLDKNNIILDKGDNLIPSADNATESISIVNDKVSDVNLTVEPAKIDGNSVIKESASKATDSNVTVEQISKSDDDNTAVSTIEATDVNMTVETISRPSDDSTTYDQTSKVIDSHVTDETSNVDYEMTADVSKENLNITGITSNLGDDKITEEPSKLDDKTTAEPISTSNDGNTTKGDDKLTTKTPTDEIITKISMNPENITEEASIETPESTFKLDENIEATPISKAIDDNKTQESTDISMMTELCKDKQNIAETTSKLAKNTAAEAISKPNDDNETKESSVDDSITKLSKDNQNTDETTSKVEENITYKPISDANDDNKTKESSINDSVPAEVSKDNQNTAETTSKLDDDMAEGPEISDSLGLLAESSRVMDDDDQDEDEDSDDFDQDDESSNLQTAEHSEESNPPSDEAQADEKETAIPDDSALEEEEIVDNEDTNTGMEIVDDIVCEETNIIENIGAVVELGIESTTPGNEILQEETPTKEESSDTSKKEESAVLKELLLKENKQADETITKSSLSKSKLTISSINDANVMTYVDLESSDEEIEEIKKDKSKESIEVKEENIVEEVAHKPTLKMTKLNTSEVTIKTGISSKPPLIIPEISNVSEIDKIKDNASVDNKECLEEIFNIDSDSEEEDTKKSTEKISVAKFNPKCINPMCTSPSTDQHYVADAAAMRHYGATKRRAICAPCLASVDTRNEALIKGIKDLTPLLDLNMEKPTNQLVEISDSESDDDSDVLKECQEFIGQEGANMLNEKLADLINDAWQKFNMDDRLKDSENYINGELKRLEDEGSKINKLLDECQVETDRIRNELYKSFERSHKPLPPIVILDTPISNYTCLEKDDKPNEQNASPFLRSVLEEPPAKRQNRGPAQTNTEAPPPPPSTDVSKQAEDDRDVSVVLLSAESAPEDLPPPGEVVRPPLRVGMQVHAMRNAFGSWLRGRILDIQPKLPGQQYTNCRVKFDHNIKNPCKVLPARCIAYQEPCSVRMTIGTRVLALFKDSNRKESFYSGVVAEIPNPVNNYRYLVFFDDGYAQYVKHRDTRLVCESKSLVWEEVHPFIRDFVKDYLLKYPERPMVRLHAGQRLNTEWNGKWWTSKVLQVDASLAHVHFEEDDRTEWIYRGSTRLAPLYLELQAAGRTRTRLPRSKAQYRTNMPYVEYMRSEEQTKQQQQLQQEEMIRRQRAVAKKSVTLPQPTPMVDKPDSVTSRVVYYTPKNAVKPHKMVPHPCGVHCKRTDVLALKDLRTYNPLAKPLLSGWERMQVRFKGSKHIMYRAPCGRRIRDMKELHRYLRAIQSDLPVDLFDFNVNTHCLAEFVLHKYNVMKKDLSHGKESVPVPCVNYYDDTLPEFCSYNTERTPTAGVPLNLDPDFLCGCDCEDDCEDKTKCACWKMTLEGARTIGLDSPNVGYVYRRLPEPLPSGIYECNSRCKCKSTCLNRVAQHPLQLKLQVFKTLKRGWGIRALNDVPKGSFLCVYAGNLLTDATANLDGLNEGDEYLAELDYIEVVEQMKEGYEEDIPEADKKLDKKESKQSSSEEEQTESEDENPDSDKNDKEDGDFQPGYIGLGLAEFNKRLRKRGKKKQIEEQETKEKETDEQKSGDCITISDDEEVREPSRFTAQAGMGDKGFISKYRSVRSLFGKDEACYIMDAKVQGNIGRYLNHSCCPNVFVQNVFVDTHDPRFPWVAFFALSHIRAGTELTWNYNYDIGSVPGKILYCYCGAHNCRGRLL